MTSISPSNLGVEHTPIDMFPKCDVQNGLKLAFLFGILSFQGCHHASAITEIATGLQSTSFLGDLDDIGTGFTSVRKPSRL